MDNSEHVVAVILGLRPKFRVPFVMAFVQRKTRSQIADALGISARAVDRRIIKALVTCRRRLESRGGALANANPGTPPECPS